MKKVLASLLALVLLAGFAAPAYAFDRDYSRDRSGVRVRNENWIGDIDLDFEAESKLGDEYIKDNAGDVYLETWDAVAVSDVEFSGNTNDTKIDCDCVGGDSDDCGYCGGYFNHNYCGGYNQFGGGDDETGSVYVTNENDVADLDVDVEAEAENGDDKISGNAGSVTVVLGAASSSSTGFITVNSNVTRLRGSRR